MTSVPSAFIREVMTDFVRACGRCATTMPWAFGFVRAGVMPLGKLSMVVDRWSGRYPPYAGLDGTRFSDACVDGGDFASCSSNQIVAADRGGGLMSWNGNCAGEGLNPVFAAEKLTRFEIDIQTVFVTEGVASVSPRELIKRCGMTGMFAAYNVGGASVDRGDNLANVERMMRLVKDQTRPFGVVFAECHLPGGNKPRRAQCFGGCRSGICLRGRRYQRYDPPSLLERPELRDPPRDEDGAQGTRIAVAAVMRVGEAVAGDKTMMDALIPLVETLEGGIADGPGLSEAWSGSVSATTHDTQALVPRLGHARPLPERSSGTPDLGAVPGAC